MKSIPGEKPAVLFVRFSSLGDVVLTTPAVRSLKAAFPGARISFLTKGAYSPLLEGHPDIDRVIAFEPRPGQGGFSALTGLCRGLGTFDLVIDLHVTLRSRLVAAFLPASRKVRYRKDSLMRRLWAMGWMRERMLCDGRHVADRYLHALEPLGVSPRFTRPEIFLTPREVDSSESFLRQMGVRDPRGIAVILPGARWSNKQWTAKGFAAVGEVLSSRRGFEIVVAGDRGDRPAVDAFKRELSTECVDIAGKTGIRELAAVLRLARVAVGNDSGPGHLAAAVGTPVVTIFGPTTEAFGFAPRGERVKTVSLPLPCRPCSIHGGRTCPGGRRACLEDLEPRAVIAAVGEVLDTPC